MKKYGLIGRSLRHSYSKSFFEHYFQAHAIESSYENVELETIDEVPEVLKSGFSGLNVTIPYKEQIIPYLDELSNEAHEIGAVNVVGFRDNRSIGYNTDAYGFHQSIKPFLTNLHERAIIFGTGGASKAIEYALKSIGVDVIFISRNPEGANEFAYKDVNDHMINACKLLVNCTPVGMYPFEDAFPDISYSCLTPQHLVVDLIYNPEKTKFLEKAEENGATIINGESMLKQQALKAWEIWNM